MGAEWRLHRERSNADGPHFRDARADTQFHADGGRARAIRAARLAPYPVT